MNYSNTDCLNNELTYSSPISFNAKAINNNCATFNGTTDYIYLGNNYVYSAYATGIKGAISCNVKFNSSSSQKLFCGILGITESITANYTTGIYIGALNKNVSVFLYSTAMWTFPTSTGYYDKLTDGNWHNIYYYIEKQGIQNDSNVFLYIDGIRCIGGAVNFDGNSKSDISLIGVGRSGDSTLNNNSYSNCNICNFKVYNSPLTESEIFNCNTYNGDKLVAWYPMAEGSNNIIYDAVGNINGRLTSTSISTCWETKQDMFAYNLTQGFKQEPTALSAFTNAKVPNNKNITIYKSDLSTNADGWFLYNGSSTSYDSTNKCFNVSSAANSTFASLHNNLLPSYASDYYGTSYRLHTKIKNNGINNITQLQYFMYGNTDLNSIALKYETVNILPGEFLDLWVDMPKNARFDGTAYYDKSIRLLLRFSSAAVETTDNQWALYECELQQVDNFDNHPKVDNGHNLAESTLDWSNGITNIAEITNTLGTSAYTPLSDTQNLYKKSIANGEQNYLLYSQPQTGINLKRINNKLR